MKRSAWLLAFPLVLVFAGCAAKVANPFERAGTAGRLRIEVRNLNFNDATLHLVTDGSRSRLGTVTGKGNGVFSIAWGFPRDVWIEVDLVGGGTFSTNSVSGQAGENLQLLIESDRRRTRLIHTGGSGDPGLFDQDRVRTNGA